ncbi:MAG: tetratricopeptide repeat protein, partial [Chloroflexota bacterium]|nr:tetratricopeptide repeat protein [Chloroflexota bacterium]
VLGDLARIENDYARARVHYEKALELIRPTGNSFELPALLHNLGYVAVAEGKIEEAQRLFEESLTQHLAMDNKMGIAETLAGFAAVAARRGEPERAARLFGAVDAMWEAAKMPMWPAERADWERNVAHACAQLDEPTWQRLWQEGRSMSREASVAYALER